MTDSGMEKRLYPRRTLRTRVTLEDELGDGFIYFYTTDISLGGLFIESEIPLKIGTKIFLSFSLPDSDHVIRTTGEVVRLEKLAPSYSGVSGMGIRYFELDPSDKQAIEAYTAQTPA